VSSAVMKAFSVLRLLRRTLGPQPDRCLASLKIAPSSAHSILNELLAQGVIVQDTEKRYRLGPATFYLGAAFARGVRYIGHLERVGCAGSRTVPDGRHRCALGGHHSFSASIKAANPTLMWRSAQGSPRRRIVGKGIPRVVDSALSETLHQYTPRALRHAAVQPGDRTRPRSRVATDDEEFTVGVGR